MRTALLAVWISLSLITAGCTSPFGLGGTATPGEDGATDSPASTVGPTSTLEPTESSAVTVRGGSLPVDATAVWLRFLDLRGLDPDRYPQPVVEVRPVPNRTLMGVPWIPGLPSQFEEGLGFEQYEIEPDDVEGPGGTPGSAGIIIYPNNGSPAEIEKTLVHEFEHYVQPDTLPLPRESRHLETVIQEGAATYVEVAYAEAHLDGVDLVENRRSRYLDATHQVQKQVASHYYFGYRYVDRRIDSPRELSEVYDDPPLRTAQVLHGDDWDGSRPLLVEYDDSWDRAGRPAGELLLRVMLAWELDESTAASAAAGWANDTVLGGESGHVWVIRTTDARNASELAAAFRRYLNATATAEADLWRTEGTAYRLVRVDAGTVALVVGDVGFVREVTVSADGGTVVVANDG